MSVPSSDQTPRRELKIWSAAEYLTNFEVFHLVMKHCVKCLINYYFSNKIILERELRMQKWAVFHLISKHSLNVNLLARFAGYTCRSSWQQTLLKVQSQCQTSNMVSAHCTPQSYSSTATVCSNRALNIYRDKYLCKKRIIVFMKSSLQLGQGFKTWILPFIWKSSSHIFLSPISICFRRCLYVERWLTGALVQSWSTNIQVSTCRVLAALQATV